MKADLTERIASGGLPKEVGEEALRDLRENPVSKEAWQDMQVGCKTLIQYTKFI
jgi:hypothetical protein